MKNNFLMGLFLGLVIVGGANYFIVQPQLQKSAYEKGQEAGRREGVASGISIGVSEQEAKFKAELKRASDSSLAALNSERATRKAAARVKRTPRPVQNWHVIDGRIADAIPE